jgi:hypothetical protein
MPTLSETLSNDVVPAALFSKSEQGLPNPSLATEVTLVTLMILTMPLKFQWH